MKWGGTNLPTLRDPRDSTNARKSILELLAKINETYDYATDLGTKQLGQSVNVREVYAQYGRAASQNIGYNSTTIVIWDTKVTDTDSAMNTSTGEYTVPVSGEYNISSRVLYGSAALTYSANFNITVSIFVNGVAKYTGRTPILTGNTNLLSADVSANLYLNAGEIVTIRTYQLINGGTVALQNDATLNYVTIFKTSPVLTLPNVPSGATFIVDSGSNANGSWRKMSDGTMDCWGMKTSAVLTNNIQNNNIGTYGWTYYYGIDTVTFPQSFINTSYTMTVIGYARGASSRTQNSKTTTTQGYVVFSADPTDVATVEWIAHGRWTTGSVVAMPSNVIECGGDATNGYWEKRPDGVMEQWGWGYTQGNNGNVLLTSNYNFPIAFTTIGDIKVSACGYKVVASGIPTSQIDTTGLTNEFICSASCTLSTFTAAWAKNLSASLVSTNYFIHLWRAIGKWK